jgi:lysylphosphatidylglycerol synthetase-like protein (DUF2156 family)
MSKATSSAEELPVSRGQESQSILSYEAAKSLLHPPLGIIIIVWLVRLSAVVDLLSSFLQDNQSWLSGLVSEIPFEISEGRQVRLFLLSVLLFILASGLLRGKRAAWICTLAILALIPILHLGHALVWPQTLFNFSLIGLLIYHRRYFVAASDRQSVRSALIICPLLGVLLLIFGTVRLHDLRDETSGSDDWLACFQTAGELEFTQESQTQQPQTFTTARFFSILCISGTLIALLGVFLALRPVLLQRRVQDENRERVRHLIDQYGDDPHDDYTLLPDKRHLFTSDGHAVVPYVLSDNIAVALADPIGPQKLRPMAIVDFALFCRRHDWEPVFYAVSEELIPYYKQAGLSLFKIGEGAALQADQFHLVGNDFQNLRTLRNGAHRRGIRFQWYDSTLGIDETLEHKINVISHRWLETKHAREMAFDMGSFSIEAIRRHGAAIAIDSSGEPLAFATWRPFAKGQGRALDLMRTLPHARNVMDFVLIESIFHFNSLGITRINLGMAPLANTEHSPSGLVAEEKVVQFLFENLNHIYGYKSLFEFKRKYRPHWRGRYVAYRRGVHLPLIGLAMVRVHAPEGIWKFFVR